MKRIYIGNLPYGATEAELERLFASFGTVYSVAVVRDHESEHSRGFGFVEMDDEPATRAIEALHGASYAGRQLTVNEARRRPPHPRQAP